MRFATGNTFGNYLVSYACSALTLLVLFCSRLKVFTTLWLAEAGSHFNTLITVIEKVT